MSCKTIHISISIFVGLALLVVNLPLYGYSQRDTLITNGLFTAKNVNDSTTKRVLKDSTSVKREAASTDTTKLAQIIEDWPDEYLDTVKLDYTQKLNDYSMIGVSYGLTSTGMSFSPSQKQKREILPGHIGVTFTHYEKMFGYLPYFGWTIGIEYGWEGYRFKENKETGVTYEFYKEKCQSLRMRVIEVPFMMQIHKDGLHSKVYAGLGVYGGYRLNVERFGPNVEEQYRTNWYDTDIRWDYGFQGGAGFAIIFEPIEFHINAQLRYGMSSIFTPTSLFPEDSPNAPMNKVYYRYAYPLDIMISAGIHIQLGKRFGTTKSDLKRKAKEIVYGK